MEALLIYKGKNIHSDDPDELTQFLNSILSTGQYKTVLNKEQSDQTLRWTNGENELILMVDNPTVLKQYAARLLFDKNTLVDHPELYGECEKLNYFTVMKLMLNQCLTDPYHLFIYFFNLNEDLFFQAFTCYLNMSIKPSLVVKHIDLLHVQNNFFVNGSSGGEKYTSLLLFYIHNRKLTPVTIEYTKPSLSPFSEFISDYTVQISVV